MTSGRHSVTGPVGRVAVVFGGEERPRYELTANRTERLPVLEQLGTIESLRDPNDLATDLTPALVHACSHTARTRTHP